MWLAVMDGRPSWRPKFGIEQQHSADDDANRRAEWLFSSRLKTRAGAPPPKRCPECVRPRAPVISVSRLIRAITRAVSKAFVGRFVLLSTAHTKQRPRYFFFSSSLPVALSETAEYLTPQLLTCFVAFDNRSPQRPPGLTT